MTTRIRWRQLALIAVMATAGSLVSAAPAHAAVEYLGVRDWTTFASWKAPSGNIYTAQYRASVAHDTLNDNVAWRLNTRCLVNGSAATCGRYAALGLGGYVSDPGNWRWPWGTTSRSRDDYKGELIWQGEWHNPGNVPEFWFFTWGLIQVHWTAPDKDSTSHYICSNDVYYDGSPERFRNAPGACVP